jgi:polyhydroxyalkanoate synthase subunit PhaE
MEFLLRAARGAARRAAGAPLSRCYDRAAIVEAQMSNGKSDPAADFAQLAKQYWSAWSDFGAGPGAAPQVPGWQDGLAWWSKLAGQGNGQVEATLEKMNAQAGNWFGAMQQLAAGLSGRDANANEVANAWSQMLGGAGGNPVADMFKRMSGSDAHGIEQWMAQAAPLLGGWRGEADALLRMPAFGLGREQQEHMQQLGQAQLAYHDRLKDYNAQLARAGKGAFERFERKLGERSEPGRQIESARALFDLWIDAAEEAWAEVALSSEYQRAYGELVNAQMRLRAGLQRQVEQAAGALGLPTRSEVNASHRKVAQLALELRAMRAELGVRRAAPAARAPAPPAPAPRDQPSPSRPRAAAPARKAAAAPAARKSAVRQSPRKAMLPHVAAPRAVQPAPAGRKTTAAKTGRKGR